MSLNEAVNINLRQVIIALETAVDLVGMNDTNHGKRVGYIASQLAHYLGYSNEDVRFSFELGLLHDCGVSTEQMHNNLVNYFDWENTDIHCNIGYKLLKDFKPLSNFAIPILYHHTPWNELQKLDISEKDKFMSNLIFLADRIDISAAPHYGKDILLARQEIVSMIKSYSGTYFDPELINVFLKIENVEAFWISLEDRHITRYTWDMGLYKNTKTLSLFDIKQLALIMGYIVDQKSKFTAQHSTGVGKLAKYLASVYGLSSVQCKKVEIAGYLHDIGKLKVPDSILDKEGPLNIVERSIIDQHSYETYEILRRIEGLEDIATWAAYHHEDISGTGYPFHPIQKDLSIEARIIAVADVFQALIQDRPYRNGMTLDKVITILDECVNENKLEKTIVNIAKQKSKECFKIARCYEQVNKKNNLPSFLNND